MSKLARVSATLTFLNGYLRLSDSLEANAVKKGTKNPRIFPPVSGSIKEISLLDPSIIELYFRKYNYYLNSRDENTLNKAISSGKENTWLVKSAIKSCGG